MPSKKRIAALIFCLLLLPGLVNAASKKKHTQQIPFTVEHVVDGDTLVVLLDGERERVRLIGIDSPPMADERKARGIGKVWEGVSPSAADRAKRRLEELTRGGGLSLEKGVETRDQYGRLLAYLYRSDGSMINRILLAEGYGRVMMIKPNTRYKKEFLAIFDQVRCSGKGIWYGAPKPKWCGD